jgi:hypothetical protein
MALQIKNIVELTRGSAQLGEALQAVQQYVNTNVTPVKGNLKLPPIMSGLTSVNATRIPT